MRRLKPKRHRRSSHKADRTVHHRALSSDLSCLGFCAVISVCGHLTLRSPITEVVKMKRRKRIPVPERKRRLPAEGWAWIDRRFLREFADSLERDSVFLYFFLASVSDKDGLSYYSDPAIASRLRMEESAVVRAREDLETRDLISFDPPYYQVLSLPERTRLGGSGPTLLADIMREIAGRADAPCRRERS